MEVSVPGNKLQVYQVYSFTSFLTAILLSPFKSVT